MPTPRSGTRGPPGASLDSVAATSVEEHRWPHGAPLAGALLALAVVGWWVTGLRPFTATAYVAVGSVIGLVAALDLSLGTGRRRGDDAVFTEHAAAPWMALLVVAVALEVAGLALGGRSSAVPTLSTVVDHALGTHVVRFATFAAWIAVGVVPAVRRSGWSRC